MVNSPLIRPYFLGGGGLGGVPLDCHEYNPLTNLSLVTSWGIMVMNAVGDEILASHILDKAAWPYQKSTTWYFGNSFLKQWYHKRNPGFCMAMLTTR